ncbi:oxidation resistance protein 1 [Xylographa trunciseda]|nr:oxidation resistance protein 1 [Xylographa trunciseda]
MASIPLPSAHHAHHAHHASNGVYTPPHRTASPFQPPPLTPLTLRGISATAAPTAQILSRALAEEIRLLVPPRQQLIADWTLAYSVEQHGASLSTLYHECAARYGPHAGYVLAVRDARGGTFGAFLTDAPAPAPHYYGTGECFLWRASVAAHMQLPPPPSEDTTHLHRSTTIASSTAKAGASTPERIRFRAFPYTGVNDYVLYCRPDFLSVGGGDGTYGLWLDSVLERGVSGRCLTFGNEGLSDEGPKFDILGVEVWYLGT